MPRKQDFLGLGMSVDATLFDPIAKHCVYDFVMDFQNPHTCFGKTLLLLFQKDLT